jgi:hypothetical protein
MVAVCEVTMERRKKGFVLPLKLLGRNRPLESKRTLLMAIGDYKKRAVSGRIQTSPNILHIHVMEGAEGASRTPKALIWSLLHRFHKSELKRAGVGARWVGKQ